MTENNVTKLNPVPATRPDYVSDAIRAGASVEALERIMAMQERWEANEARKAFNRAIAQFKAKPPAILKNVQVGYDSRRTGEHVGYKHEDLAELLAAVDPALAEHGLWLRFKIDSNEPGKIKVTCVVGHEAGYSEEPASLTGSPDTSGNKNPLQAIASTVSYLQRYTAKAALGLAAARDDDGKAGGGSTAAISEKQADEINTKLLENPGIDVDKFLQLAGAPSVSDILAIKFDAAMGYLKRQASKKGSK